MDFRGAAVGIRFGQDFDALDRWENLTGVASGFSIVRLGMSFRL
jgi:hypothetical protein